MNFLSRLLLIRIASLSLSLLALAGSLFFAGCKDAFKVEDPQLKPIEEMVAKNVPIGCPQATVLQFLSARGYETEDVHPPHTIVAIIRHIDTEKMQPVTARVTFHFDEHDKLKSFEVVRTMNAPIPQ